MRQQSDLVQHTATAYAEREVLGACCRTLGAAGGVRGGGVSPALRALLEPVVALYALHRLEQVGSGASWEGQGCRAMMCAAWAGCLFGLPGTFASPPNPGRSRPLPLPGAQAPCGNLSMTTRPAPARNC